MAARLVPIPQLRQPQARVSLPPPPGEPKEDANCRSLHQNVSGNLESTVTVTNHSATTNESAVRQQDPAQSVRPDPGLARMC